MKELRIIAEQLEANSHEAGAAFLRKVVELGEKRGVFPNSLGLTILKEGEEYPLVEGTEKDPIYHHPLFDYDSRNGSIATNEGIQTELTGNENSILKYLSERPNVYIPLEVLNSEVLGIRPDSGSSKIHIVKLRKRLPFWVGEGKNRKHLVIKSKRKFGYMLFDPSRLGDESGSDEAAQS